MSFRVICIALFSDNYTIDGAGCIESFRLAAKIVQESRAGLSKIINETFKNI